MKALQTFLWRYLRSIFFFFLFYFVEANLLGPSKIVLHLFAFCSFEIENYCLNSFSFVNHFIGSRRKNPSKFLVYKFLISEDFLAKWFWKKNFRPRIAVKIKDFFTKLFSGILEKDFLAKKISPQIFLQKFFRSIIP